MTYKIKAILGFALTLALATLTLLSGAGLAAESAGAAGQSGHQRLADLLEDEATRTALIEQLRRLGELDAAASPPPVDPAEEPIASRIADLTQSLAQGAVSEARAAFHSVGQAWDSLAQSDPGELLRDLGEFAALVVATLLIFRLLRSAAGVAFRAFDRHAAKSTGTAARAWVRRALAIVAAGIVDVSTIALAWLVGYGIALFILGASGEMSLQESLFLNAFLLIELIRALLRVVFSRRGENLRPLPMSAEESAYWYSWASRMVFFLGYGLMLAVPLINHYLTPELGRATSILILLAALLNAIVIVMQNRLRVRSALERRALRTQSPVARVTLNMGARIWHFVANAYLGAIVVTSILYPEHALPFMIAATAQTIVAVAVGIALAAVLTQVILRRIRIGDEMRDKFPLLEARLNAYVPTALRVARLTIAAIVIAVIVDAWTPFDLGAWVASDAGTFVLGRVVSIMLIIAIALLVWLLVASWIEFRLNPHVGAPNPRARTLLTIFRNAIAIALVVLTVMVVLAEVGLNIAPLLAGAGVLGLAIGFGAQKLVQDVITGVFIQLENAINVGDIVTAAGTTGVVEQMTIRSLGMRDLSGTYHLLPFSSVDMVSNYMREFAFHVGEYGVAYREDTDNVIVHLRAAFDELVSDPDHRQLIVGDELEVHGVTALADSSVTIRVRIKTLPGSQFAIGREYNRLVKRHFDAAGIEIPFPHMTVYFGEDRQGNAPPARVNLVHRPAISTDPRDGRKRLDVEAARSNPQFKGDFDEVDD